MSKPNFTQYSLLYSFTWNGSFTCNDVFIEVLVGTLKCHGCQSKFVPAKKFNFAWEEKKIKKIQFCVTLDFRNFLLNFNFQIVRLVRLQESWRFRLQKMPSIVENLQSAKNAACRLFRFLHSNCSFSTTCDSFILKFNGRILAIKNCNSCNWLLGWQFTSSEFPTVFRLKKGSELAIFFNPDDDIFISKRFRCQKVPFVFFQLIKKVFI